MTWEEVRDARSRGIRFGAHSVSHPKLYHLPWPAIRRELLDSRQTLEDRLQEPVTSFAYPYAFPEHDARFVGRFVELARELGYDSVVTTSVGVVRHDSDRMRLQRLHLSSGDDAVMLKAKLAGDYDWFNVPQRLFKRVRMSRPRAMDFQGGSTAGSSSDFAR